MDPNEPPAVIVVRAKKLLRKRFLSRRRSIPVTGAAQRSEAIVATLLELEQISGAKRIAIFWPLTQKREVDLRAFAERCWSENKVIALPRVEPVAAGSDETDIVFRQVTTPDDLETGTFGVQEPSLDAPVIVPDAVVVPGLTFDPTGYRIGYGGGYYDRALAKLPNAFKVGVVFDFLLSAELPKMEYDQPVDAVVTEKQVIRVS